MKAKEFGPMQPDGPSMQESLISFGPFSIKVYQYHGKGDHYFTCKELGFDREQIKNPILSNAQAIALDIVEERLELYTKCLPLVSQAARWAEDKLPL